MVSIISFAVLALVTVVKCQDITSLMFQALEVEAPPMPPKMPTSLRQHLYPQQQQHLQRQHQQLLLQERQLLAFKAAQMQREAKQNPYSISYSNGLQAERRGDNLLNSPANAIRQPGGGANSIGVKVNPYTVRVKNPYSTSRQETSIVPGIRKTTSSLPSDQRSDELRATMRAIRKMTLLPKKIKDAKMAGCKLPIDSTAASVLMFNTCQSRTAQLICQSKMMRCHTVGMAAMCCPLYIHNNLAMDTASYVNKLENYVADMQ